MLNLIEDMFHALFIQIYLFCFIYFLAESILHIIITNSFISRPFSVFDSLLQNSPSMPPSALKQTASNTDNISFSTSQVQPTLITTDLIRRNSQTNARTSSNIKQQLSTSSTNLAELSGGGSGGAYGGDDKDNKIINNNINNNNSTGSGITSTFLSSNTNTTISASSASVAGSNSQSGVVNGGLRKSNPASSSWDKDLAGLADASAPPKDFVFVQPAVLPPRASSSDSIGNLTNTTNSTK